MKPLEITIAISPADLDSWKGAEVPIRFVITKRSVEVCIPQPTSLTPGILTQLRATFSEIKPSLSQQSRELLCFLLNTDKGQATREELIDSIWPKKDATCGDVRKAVHYLNTAMKRLKFGCIVRGDRKGVFHLLPISW